MKRSRRAGLSLVEVMISMAVLAFVLLAFMSIMWSATELSASSKEASIGTFELQNAIEDIFAVGYVNFVTAGPWAPAGQPATGFVYTLPSNANLRQYSALPNEVITFNWTAWDTLHKVPNWAEFQVTIKWTDHRNRTVTDSLTTRRSQ